MAEPSCVSAGLNASNATTHHLPFAEASLSHKHRKRVGSEGDLEDSAATDNSAAAEEGDLFVQKPPASAEQVHLLRLQSKVEWHAHRWALSPSLS